MDYSIATEAYLEAALWSEGIGAAIEDISSSTRQQAKKDVQSFIERAGTLLEGWDEAQIGHDFWLTRNHHGTGFWNRGGEIGRKLSAISQSFKELNVWEWHGVVYFE